MKLYYWQDEKAPEPNWIITEDGAACAKAYSDRAAGKEPDAKLVKYQTPDDGAKAKQ